MGGMAGVPPSPLYRAAEASATILGGAQQARAQEEADERHVKALTDVVTKTFDKASAYTNVIMVAGYAGGFTIWSFTKSQLTDRASIVVALALLVSLTAFITFEVVKMVLTGRMVLGRTKALTSANSATQKMEAVRALDAAYTAASIRFMRFWAVAFTIAALSASIAIALLGWNFLAILTGLPRWPV